MDVAISPREWLTKNIAEPARYLMRGPGSVPSAASSQPAKQSLTESTPARSHTSVAFESHITEANYAAKHSKSNGNKAISLAWDENEGRGITGDMRQWEGLSERDRKETLLEMYLANPWVSTCVDVIAKRITSGGFAVEPVKQGEGNPKNQETLRQFCLLINDHWDFLQFIRSIIMDLLIFGEAYCEIIRGPGGIPQKLFKIDCLTMTYKLDRYGNILEYNQQLSSTTKPNKLDVNSIIRWWFPHPGRSMDALSPMERVKDAVNVDKKMVNWVTTFFQKGAKVPFWIKSDADQAEATRQLAWIRETQTGEKNAHAPLMTYGGAEVKEFGRGAIDIDFGKGRDRNRTEILAAYNVPPAIAGIIESGNIGGGSGEDQEKSFQYNTCDPVKQLVFEKLNFVIVQGGFKITDFLITTRYADYRNDENVAKVQDMRIRNGSLTINESRQEGGKLPYPKTMGGDTPVFAVSKEVIPVPRLDDLEDEQRTQAQQQLEQGDAQTELLKTQVEKAKNPPPVPPALQQFAGQQQNQQASDNNKNVIPQGKQPEKPAQEPGKKVATTIRDKKTQTQEAVSEQSTDDSFDDEDTLTAIPAVKKPTMESFASPVAAQQQIWQPPDIDVRLALLKKKGVATKEFEADENPCELCLSNDKKRVSVDEAFPSGHLDTPCHPHCGCECIYRDKDGNEIKLANLGDEYQ